MLTPRYVPYLHSAYSALGITAAPDHCANVCMCAPSNKPQHKVDLLEESRRHMALPVPFDANETRRLLDPLHRDDEVLLFLVYAHVRCERVARCNAASAILPLAKSCNAAASQETATGG